MGGLSKDPEKRRRQVSNLKPPIKPGEVRNPEGINGRPLTSALLRKATPERREQLADSIWGWAADGQSWAVTLLMDRIDGPVPKDVNLQQQGAVEIVIRDAEDWRSE